MRGRKSELKPYRDRMRSGKVRMENQGNLVIFL